MGAAPAGGLGELRPGMVFKFPAEQLWVVCKLPPCASWLSPAQSLDDEREEAVEPLGRAARPSLEETPVSGGSEQETTTEAAGAWTAGSEELLGTEGSSRLSVALAEPSDVMLSRLRAGDGVEEGGSERESLERGW